MKHASIKDCKTKEGKEEKFIIVMFKKMQLVLSKTKNVQFSMKK